MRNPGTRVRERAAFNFVAAYRRVLQFKGNHSVIWCPSHYIGATITGQGIHNEFKLRANAATAKRVVN